MAAAGNFKMIRDQVLAQILSSQCNIVVTHAQENKRGHVGQLKKGLIKSRRGEDSFDEGFFVAAGVKNGDVHHHDVMIVEGQRQYFAWNLKGWGVFWIKFQGAEILVFLWVNVLNRNKKCTALTKDDFDKVPLTSYCNA